VALIGFDSGEATRYPSYQTLYTDGSWYSIANQPSAWQVYRLLANGITASAGFQTTTKFYGTTAARIGSTYSAGGSSLAIGMRRTFANAPFSETYIAFVFNVDSLVARDILALTAAAGTVSVRLAIDGSGQLLVYAGAGAGTLKATIATGWSANAWHSIQLHQKTATNTLEVKIDGGATIDCSGTAMLPWSFILIGNPLNAISNTNALNCYYDSLTVNDNTGSYNNTWPGSPRIPTALRPSSDTAVTDWIRSGGANDFDMIKEVPPDLDTTYVSSAVAGDTSTYGFASLGESATTLITGICLTAVAKRADAAFLIPVISRGGTTPDLTSLEKAIGSDYMTPIEWFFDTDPITGLPWTQANLNATYFGFKHSIT